MSRGLGDVYKRQMLGFVRGLGFTLHPDPDDPALVVTTLDLARRRLAEDGGGS